MAAAQCHHPLAHPVIVYMIRKKLNSYYIHMQFDSCHAPTVRMPFWHLEANAPPRQSPALADPVPADQPIVTVILDCDTCRSIESSLCSLAK